MQNLKRICLLCMVLVFSIVASGCGQVTSTLLIRDVAKIEFTHDKDKLTIIPYGDLDLKKDPRYENYTSFAGTSHICITPKFALYIKDRYFHDNHSWETEKQFASKNAKENGYKELTCDSKPAFRLVESNTVTIGEYPMLNIKLNDKSFLEVVVLSTAAVNANHKYRKEEIKLGDPLLKQVAAESIKMFDDKEVQDLLKTIKITAPPPK